MRLWRDGRECQRWRTDRIFMGIDSDARDPGVRRIVVGIDGSAESVAALGWACRELACAPPRFSRCSPWSPRVTRSLVLPSRPPRPPTEAGAQPATCCAKRSPRRAAGIRASLGIPGSPEGLAARVLLDHALDADMLVLGRTSYGPDPYRAAGPVIRACLRASACPVVIIGSAEAARPVPASWQHDLQGSSSGR